MKNMIEHLSDPIDNSLIHLKDYLNENQYNSFKTNLNTQSQNIKKYLQDFYKKENIHISDSIKVINGLSSIYNSIENEIKTKINDDLTKYSNLIFNQLKPLNIQSGSIPNNQTLTLGSFSEDILGEVIQFKATIPDSIYSYSLQLKYQNFSIYTNVFVYGETSINVENSYSNKKGSIDGKVGAGDMTLKTYNELRSDKIQSSLKQESKSVSYKKSLWDLKSRIEKKCKRVWYTLWIKKKCKEEVIYYWEKRTKLIKTNPSRMISEKIF